MNFPDERSSGACRSPSHDPRWADDLFTPWRFAAFLVTALFLIFPRVMTGSETLFYRDFGVIAYPVIFHHHESLWRGDLPFWNPLSNCGAPFLAQWGAMALYPGNFFYLLLPLPWSVNAFCLAHLVLAGMGMYFLAWRWSKNRFAAAAAGTFFVFNGVTFSCLIWPNYVVALGWMPWVVLAAERAWDCGGRKVVIAGLVAALQVLAGVPEIAVFTWMLIAVVVVASGISSRFRSFGHRLARIGLVLALVSGLVAIQIWPFLDLLVHSHRSAGLSISKWPLPIWALGNLFVPLFHCFPTAQGVYFQNGQEFFSSTYLGITAVVLAGASLGMLRTARTVLLAVTVLLSFWMALGEPGLLFGQVKQLFPFLNVARYPVKFVLLPAMIVPLLAALTIARLQESGTNEPTVRWRYLFGIGTAALAGIAFVTWIARRNPLPLDDWTATWQSGLERAVVLAVTIVLLRAAIRGTQRHAKVIAGAGIILLTAVDLITHVPSQNPTIPSAALAPNFWEDDPPRFGTGRIMISPRAEDHLLMSRVRDPYKDLIGKRLAAWSNLNLLDQIPKVNGSSTLQIREQMQVQTLLYASTNQPLNHLMDFLGVSMITAPDSIIEWTNRPGSMPLLTIGQKPVFADPPDTLNAWTNHAFDPRLSVYLPHSVEPEVRAVSQSSAIITPKQITAHKIEAETESEHPAIAVIAQSYYPAWRAYVDGNRVPLWRANHAFQAVEVPAGRHQLALLYQDRSFRLGAMLSALTLAGCMVALSLGRLSPATPAPPASARQP